MLFKMFLQGTYLLCAAGFLTAAVAIPIREWEGEEGRFDEESPRAFSDGNSQTPEETDMTDAHEVMEVAVSPKRQQNSPLTSRKDLALVPLAPNKGVKSIKDETQITGENAKKKLPPYVVHKGFSQPPLIHDISQVMTTSFLPGDFQGQKD